VTKVEMKAGNFETFNVSCDDVTIDGENALRVVKTKRIYDFDINSFARLKNEKFHNGEIKVKVMSRLLPDCDERFRVRMSVFPSVSAMTAKRMSASM